MLPACSFSSWPFLTKVFQLLFHHAPQTALVSVLISLLTHVQTEVFVVDPDAPEVEVTRPGYEYYWRNHIIIGCTVAAAIEVVIVVLIVLYWKQIRWTLRKIVCPCVSFLLPCCIDVFHCTCLLLFLPDDES
jgi:hypothetical protein